MSRQFYTTKAEGAQEKLIGSIDFSYSTTWLGRQVAKAKAVKAI